MKRNKTQSTALTILLFLPLWVCLLAAPTEASAAIAKVSSFKGDVLVQSGDLITQLKKPGYALNDGDSIQTKQGEAQVIFNDGAVLKINPFSKSMIQERKEQSGVWIFKTVQNARRVTCFVGKLWFKSGSSDTKNYMQTPTAVAGLRGSDGEIGFDNVKSYLNMFTGEAAVVGDVIRGFFENPGTTAAQKSAVYQAVVAAAAQYQKATAGVNQARTDTEKAAAQVLLTQAKISALQAVQTSFTTLSSNPDKTVNTQAVLAATATSAVVAASQAKLAVDQANSVKATADAAVKATTDPAAQAAAQKAADDAAKAAAAAQTAANTAAQAAADARAAQAAQDQAAADAAAKRAQDAQKQAQQATTSSVGPTSSVGQGTTTVGKDTSTVGPTTMPATTIESTTSTSTTTTSSTSTSTCPSPPCK